MHITRRQLLQIGVIQAGLLSLPSRSESFRVHQRESPSIIQGITDQERTQFSVVHKYEQNFIFEVHSSRGQLWLPDQVIRHDRIGQDRAITKIHFSKLHLGEDFKLILKDSISKKILDQREFQMLDVSKDLLRFAICSCMDDLRHTPEIWMDLIAQKTDFILFAGDSTYCDFGPGSDEGAARLWRRFSEARATLEIYFSQRLIPIFATWDDHDFGKNDAGRGFPHLQDSQKNFLQFFAQDANGSLNFERGPGVSSRITIGKQQFILLDDRSWRVAGSSRDRFAHWGEEQENWLISAVSQNAGMNWIVNGSQVFPQMTFKESMSKEHPVQFNTVKERIKETGHKVAFISGDVHFSEISKIEEEALGYQTYELTSSSIHSKRFPGAPDIFPHPRRMVATGKNNYLLVDSQPKDNGCHFLVESRSPENRVNFSLRLEI